MEELKHISSQNESTSGNVEAPKRDEFISLPISFIPGLKTSTKIMNGEPVSFNQHVQEILKYYDVVQVSPSFIEGVSLPHNNSFYLVKPISEDFWERKADQNQYLASFIRSNQKSQIFHKPQ
jgi:hypothetical protein